MTHCMVGVLLGLALLADFVCAEEPAPKALDDAGRQKAAGLLKDLGHDDFATREDAEKGLRALGLPALPLLKDALAKTDDTEVRLRLERLVNDLALEAETDPDKLAALARKEAQAKRYEKAQALYEKAAAEYRKQAGSAADEQVKKDLTAKGDQAAARQKRAAAYAGGKQEDGNVQVVGGGGNVRIRVIAGAGGRVVVTEPDDEAGGDW
ncbi:MAG: hypothetical protein AMXMBFR7_27460 [Planctomycetota bacterium]